MTAAPARRPIYLTDAEVSEIGTLLGQLSTMTHNPSERVSCYRMSNAIHRGDDAWFPYFVPEEAAP